MLLVTKRIWWSLKTATPEGTCLFSYEQQTIWQKKRVANDRTDKTRIELNMLALSAELNVNFANLPLTDIL